MWWTLCRQCRWVWEHAEGALPHARTHTAEVWSKKAFWRTWSELSPKIGESYPWCPGSGSGATQHALEETGLRR